MPKTSTRRAQFGGPQGKAPGLPGGPGSPDPLMEDSTLLGGDGAPPDEGASPALDAGGEESFLGDEGGFSPEEGDLGLDPEEGGDETESLDDLDKQIEDALKDILSDEPDMDASALVDEILQKLEDPEAKEELIQSLDDGGEEAADADDSDTGGEEPEGEGEKEEESEEDDASEKPSKPDSKPESTSDEEPNSELDRSLMLHERRAGRVVRKGNVTARYIAGKVPEDARWEVRVLGVPKLHVIAGRCFPNLQAAPSPTVLGVKVAYRSYAETFASPMYGQSLVDEVAVSGCKHVAQVTRGTLLKGAQLSGMGTGMAQPMATGDPTGQNGPMGSTEGLPGGPEGTPEGMGDTTLNPPNEVEDVAWDSENPEKLMVSDILVDYLAPFIANKVYNPQEIVSELSAIFADEAAAKEFEGALSQKADSMVEDSKEDLATQEGEQEGDTPTMPSMPNGPASPAEPSTQPAPNGPGGMQGGMPVMAQKAIRALQRLMVAAKAETETVRTASQQKLADLEAQIDALTREREIRIAYTGALDFVNTQLVPRRMVASAEDLLREHPDMAPGEARIKAAAIAADRAKKIVRMNPDARNDYIAQVKDSPIPAAAPLLTDNSLEVQKALQTAAAQASKVASLSQERLDRTGLEGLLPDEIVGNSHLTQLAEEHKAKKRR